MSEIAKLNREYAAALRDLLNRPGISATIGAYIADEIHRLELHATRLENDHKDCVEPCCPACKMTGNKELPVFLQAYLKCAFWVPGDDKVDEKSVSDMDEDSYAQMRGAAYSFMSEHRADIGDNLEQAGHDFWLTRNHHGAGFWDRPEVYGQEQCDRLTDAAHEWGEADLYVGDDGKVYLQ